MIKLKKMQQKKKQTKFHLVLHQVVLHQVVLHQEKEIFSQSHVVPVTVQAAQSVRDGLRAHGPTAGTVHAATSGTAGGVPGHHHAEVSGGKQG